MSPKGFLIGALAVCGCALAPAPAQAQARPFTIARSALAAGIVRSYFDALRRQDEKTLSRFTVGSAARDTHAVLSRIWDEARRHDVGVELRLASLAVAPRVSGIDGTTAVDARFDIDVVAKKWFFSKVAQKLRGRATFYVGDNQPAEGAKIVGIKLYLD